MVMYLINKLVTLYLATFSPRWIFAKAYRPATEAERKESEVVRNRLRRTEYKWRTRVDIHNKQ